MGVGDSGEGLEDGGYARRHLALFAAQIVEQCRAAGAGHFAATFNRSQPPQTLKRWYADYGRTVIPALRQAAV